METARYWPLLSESFFEGVEFVDQGLRHLAVELAEELADARRLGLPVGLVDRENGFEIGFGDVETLEVHGVLGGHHADGCLDRLALAGHAVEHPEQRTEVLAETRPEEL